DLCVLPAALRSGVESGRVFEQRPQGAGERVRLAARQGGSTLAHPRVHAALAPSSRACGELLQSSIRPICRGHQFVTILRAEVILANSATFACWVNSAGA